MVDMTEYDHKLDISGKSCPLPIVKTRQKIEELEPGEVLLSISTDSGSKSDFKGWADGSNDVELLEFTKEDEKFQFYIKKV
ncbi:MAG: tRNA 2-thiouridine synthesizing protein A [Candidatus Nanohaloarchaea archaeon]|jgi:tRNA 2-thiouridine synthesizing protein A